jgi:hypothetical protein
LEERQQPNRKMTVGRTDRGRRAELLDAHICAQHVATTELLTDGGRGLAHRIAVTDIDSQRDGVDAELVMERSRGLRGRRFVDVEHCDRHAGSRELANIAAPKPEPPPITAAIFPTRSSTLPTAPGSWHDRPRKVDDVRVVEHIAHRS